MIHELTIENFKCFEKKSFNFAKLNIVAGGNGCGKSTLIQPLLLMRQSFYNSFMKLQNSIPMNGELVSLQSFDRVATDPTLGEIKFKFKFRPVPFGKRFTRYPLDELIAVQKKHKFNSATDQIGLDSYSELREDSVRIALKCESDSEVVAYLNDDDDCADVGHNLFEMGFPLASSIFEERHSIFGYGCQFIYISADRIGPRSVIPVTSTRDKINPLKRDGSASLQEIFSYNPGHSYMSEPHYQYIDDFNELFSQVFPGISLSMSIQEGVDGRACIVPFFEKGSSNKLISPNMTGFGMFYAIPVLAAPVVAGGDATVIIENPEAHLHPAAQSALGYALASRCNDDAQYFIETHSEHFINGVRKAIVSGACRCDDVALHFFSKDSVQSPSEYKEVKITQKGELNQWPRGFFDQVEIDLDLILRGTMQ